MEKRIWSRSPSDAKTLRCVISSATYPHRMLFGVKLYTTVFVAGFCARPTQFLHNSRFHLLPVDVPFRICRPADVSRVQNPGYQPSRKTVAGLVRAALLAGI